MVDTVFAAWQLQKKLQEQNRGLYTIFVDLMKVFDTVDHEDLWKIMAKFGSPEKFVVISYNFHDSTFAWVLDHRLYSHTFPVTSGVKQGFVFAAMIFSRILLSNAFSEDKKWQ